MDFVWGRTIVMVGTGMVFTSISVAGIASLLNNGPQKEKNESAKNQEENTEEEKVLQK